jgi:hypothetical protein
MKRGNSEMSGAPLLIRKHVDLTQVTIGNDTFSLLELNGQYYAATSEIFNTMRLLLPEQDLNISNKRIENFKKLKQLESFQALYNTNDLLNDAGDLRKIEKKIRHGR